MFRFAFALFALLALLLALPRVASADEGAARVHFKKGIELYDKKQYPEALTEFEAAYREKPSASIKQNIALSLKGMNRPAEAATSFDEALDEGKDTLKPETKSAIEHELTDLSKTVATVSITFVGASEKQVAETVVTITPVGQPPRALPAGAQRRPIRLLPGIYALSAKVPGQPALDPKKLALISGAPVEVSFGAEQMGTLTVHSNVPEAMIKIDGVEVGKGTWSGPLPAKTLRVEVSAAGWRTLSFDLKVPPNSAVDSPVTLQPVGSAPGEYFAPTTPPPAKPKRVYIAIHGSLEGVSYRLRSGFGEDGVRHGFAGGSLGARFGFLALKYLALEALVEAGAMGATYNIPSSAVDTVTTGSHWELAGGVRFHTPGRFRFTAGTGIGVQGINLERRPSGGDSATALKANGLGVAWLIDAGAQFDVGPLFLETVLYANVHDVSNVKVDGGDGPQALSGTLAARLGLRVGLGIPF